MTIDAARVRHEMPAQRVSPSSIVVASVPQSHVYVWHLSREHGDPVVRLPDPPPDPSLRSDQQAWWPPVMLDPGWVREHEFDVFHVHFGFDSCDPAQLRELVDVLRERGKPLVFTLHDLRNPHHTDTDLHDSHLDVLVPAADAVLTLTDGAAAEIRQRWGRDATVVPHPHVVDLPTMARLGLRRSLEHGETHGPRRVGLHVKSLRASMDPLRVLPALVDTVSALPDTVLQVNAHDELMEPRGRCFRPDVAAALRAYADRGDIDLRVHPFFSDAQLWEYFASLDVSVLPYQFGTHSGWLEACRDLGTTVVTSSCGYYADQAPVLTYLMDETTFDADSLARAVREALWRRTLPPGLRPEATSVSERRAQRERIAAVHEQLYRDLLR